MPSDLILPAFAVVLAANAVLIALAIRTFIADRSREREAVGATPTDPQVAGNGAPTATAADAVAQPGPPSTPVSTPTGDLASDSASAEDHAQVVPSAPTKSRRKRSSTAAAASTSSAATADKPTARRRRFSMPAHEEDRERFDRSIASFLSGGGSGRGSDGE